MNVKTDPLMEAIAKKLHGISQVSDVEKGRMIRRACKAAKEIHDAEIAALNAQVEAFRDAVLEYLRGNHPSAQARLRELAESTQD